MPIKDVDFAAIDKEARKLACFTLLNRVPLKPIRAAVIPDPTEEDACAVTDALYELSVAVHSLLLVCGACFRPYGTAQLRGIVKALKDGNERLNSAEPRVPGGFPLQYVIDDRELLWSTLGVHARSFKNDGVHVWALHAAAALLCIDRAAVALVSDRSLKVALSLHEAELQFGMANVSSGRIGSPEMFAAEANKVRHARQRQDLIWLWNHFLASPEYKQGAAGYKDGAKRLLDKMRDDYPDRRNLPALSTVERHFRKKLTERDGVQFKRGRPPAKKPEILRCA